jgi:hypothetical protein
MSRRCHEQRLGRHDATANPRAGTFGLEVVPHPADDRHSPRNHQRLPESRGAPGARPWSAWRRQTKTGNFRRGGVHRLRAAKPAITGEVSTHLLRVEAPVAPPGRAPSASACGPYRELIAEALGRGRSAMAIWHLVDDHRFTARHASVRRLSRRSAALDRPKPASSSPPSQAKKHKSHTRAKQCRC